MRVAVIGAGVAGLAVATELAERGVAVEVFERAGGVAEAGASRLAGAMLAPFCEAEHAGPGLIMRARGAIDWWAGRVPDVARQGSLVLAPPRETGELARFARRTEGHLRVAADEIAALEPALAGRFRTGLLFPEEAHLCPKCALRALARRLAGTGVAFHFGSTVEAPLPGFDRVVDCRGFGAAGRLAGLRGVRGEMALVRTREITLSRPVRLLHPRHPIYVVPRSDGVFMIGATMVESAATGGVTLRSALELLGVVHALHPAFGEAEILELAAGIRPAFTDNMPRVMEAEGRLFVNGLYRHGFLLAPALAREVAGRVLEEQEVLHAH